MAVTTSNPMPPTPAIYCDESTVNATEYTAATNAFNSKFTLTFTLPTNAWIIGWGLKADLKATSATISSLSMKVPSGGTAICGTNQTGPDANYYTKYSGISMTPSYFQPVTSSITCEVGLTSTGGIAGAYAKNISIRCYYIIIDPTADSTNFA